MDCTHAHHHPKMLRPPPPTHPLNPIDPTRAVVRTYTHPPIYIPTHLLAEEFEVDGPLVVEDAGELKGLG